MTTADIVTEEALALAAAGMDGDEPVERLLRAAANRRVAVVRAKQNVLAILDATPDDRAARAVVLLDATLDRMPV